MTSPDRTVSFEPERFETIRVDISDHVCRVTLDRPEVLNAFNDQMLSEIRSTWRALRRMDEVRVVVVTGAGEKAFCAGVDRSEGFVALEGTGGKLYGTSNNYMYDDPGDDMGPKACDLWKPVIAAVNGICCAGAFYLAAECDIIKPPEAVQGTLRAIWAASDMAT